MMSLATLVPAGACICVLLYLCICISVFGLGSTDVQQYCPLQASWRFDFDWIASGHSAQDWLRQIYLPPPPMPTHRNVSNIMAI